MIARSTTTVMSKRLGIIKKNDNMCMSYDVVWLVLLSVCPLVFLLVVGYSVVFKGQS